MWPTRRLNNNNNNIKKRWAQPSLSLNRGTLVNWRPLLGAAARLLRWRTRRPSRRVLLPGATLGDEQFCPPSRVVIEMREPAERADVPCWYNICHELECGGASAGGVQRKGEKKIKCEFLSMERKHTKQPSSLEGVALISASRKKSECLCLGICVNIFYQRGPYCHIDGCSAAKHPRSAWQMARCCAATGDFHLLECPSQGNVAKEGATEWNNLFSSSEHYCDELIFSWKMPPVHPPITLGLSGSSSEVGSRFWGAVQSHTPFSLRNKTFVRNLLTWILQRGAVSHNNARSALMRCCLRRFSG